MALAMTTVANSIAALSVSGVTLKDVDEIPVSCLGLTPCIIPSAEYITNLRVIRDSTGAAAAKMTVLYRLNYRLLYAQVGGGLDLKVYSDTVTKLAAFLDALLAVSVLTGAVDIIPTDITPIGVVTDPSGNEFIGCEIGLDITEFVN